jgi:cell division protein FtsB
MIVMRALRRRARVVVGPVLGIALTGYFAYNLVEGERGFIAWTRLTRQVRAEDARLDALRAERAALKLKVSDMTPDHLDPDLLDERVRATLNLVAPNERVIMKPAANAPSAPQPSAGDVSSSPSDR